MCNGPGLACGAVNFAKDTERGAVPTTKHLNITGRVQGVGFRFYFERIARQHGVYGWVRNRRNGDVEAVVHGEDSAVAAVIEWARRGPRNAAVDAVTVSETDGTYEGFEVRPTL
jgi:acylphosphatase